MEGRDLILQIEERQQQKENEIHHSRNCQLDLVLCVIGRVVRIHVVVYPNTDVCQSVSQHSQSYPTFFCKKRGDMESLCTWSVKNVVEQGAIVTEPGA